MNELPGNDGLRFNGLRIIESAYLTEPGEPYQVRRSWRERLFTRPWRPLEATRTVVPQVPMRGGYRIGNAIVMHPETARRIKERVGKARSELTF